MTCHRLLRDPHESSMDQRKRPALLQAFVLFGSPTRARTWDLRINSPSLYQLSYQGIFSKLLKRARILVI